MCLVFLIFLVETKQVLGCLVVLPALFCMVLNICRAIACLSSFQYDQMHGQQRTDVLLFSALRA